MTVAEGVRRLQEILPLQTRRSALPEAERRLHRQILRSFAHEGRPPTVTECAGFLGVDDAGGFLARLAKDDLIVLDADGSIEGAYPFTTSRTAHRVGLMGRTVHAMCALDALAMAPMFDAASVVDSRCEVEGTSLRIEQSGGELVAASPAGSIYVGIQWGTTGETAAHSL